MKALRPTQEQERWLAVAAALNAGASEAWLVERVGRKATLVAFLVGAAVAAFGFGNTGLGPDASAPDTLAQDPRQSQI